MADNFPKTVIFLDIPKFLLFFSDMPFHQNLSLPTMVLFFITKRIVSVFMPLLWVGTLTWTKWPYLNKSIFLQQYCIFCTSDNILGKFFFQDTREASNNPFQPKKRF